MKLLLILSALLLAPAASACMELPSMDEASASAHAIAESVNGSVYRIGDSHSMTPALRAHTFLVTVPVRASQVKVGDVIVFKRRTGKPIVHRVIRCIDCFTYQTKGDANGFTDVNPVRHSQVLGRVHTAIRFSPPSSN